MTNLSSVHSSAPTVTVNTDDKQYISLSGLTTEAEGGLFTGATFNSLLVLKMWVLIYNQVWSLREDKAYVVHWFEVAGEETKKQTWLYRALKNFEKQNNCIDFCF